MRYPAPWDRSLRASTTVLVALIALWAVMLGVLVAMSGAGTRSAALVSALGLLAFAAAILFSWALAPKSFSVEGSQVRVDRPLWPVAVPLARVRSAGILPDGALRGAARLGGSSGLFGYYGRYWSRRLGYFRSYSTRRSGLVLLEADELFVLSPEPADRFVEDVLGRAAGAVRAEAGAPLARRRIPRRMLFALASVVALVLLGLAGMVVGSVAFVPRGVRVEEGTIRIERRMAQPVVIPLSNVRRVETVRAPGRFRRVSGFSSAHAAYGHYRSDTLGDFQLYAWRKHGPYVLLETLDARVVLTPDDPEPFVAAVRAAIGQPR